MTTMNLLLSEMRFRWLNSALTLLAIAAAATMFVGGPTLIAGYSQQTNQLLTDEKDQLETRLTAMETERDELLGTMDKKTKRLMRDIGFNVMIFHKDTDMAEFHAEMKAVEMPEHYVTDLGGSDEITKVRHLVATLQEKYKWNDRTVLLIGILPAVVQTHLEKKPPMGYQIEPGTVYLGHELAADRKEGDRIVVGDEAYRIAKILPEQGTNEDIMIAMQLHDAQQVLGKEGKINKILALGCECEFDRLGEIREQIEKVLPDTRVTEFRSIAIARAEQRDLVASKKNELIDAEKEKHTEIIDAKEQERRKVESSLAMMFNVVAPLVVLICAIWIGLLAWNNVRERQGEIGILRALGKGSSSIAALFLGKAALLGLLGGLIGCVAGYLIAASFGSAALQTAMLWLVATVVGAPVVALLATYLPAAVAIRQDPAIVLRDQ
jgi:hypothetical protein